MENKNFTISLLQIKYLNTKVNQIKFKQSQYQYSLGFTLIEVLVAVLIMGILAAIAAPGWLSFVDARRLTIAQEDIYRAMRTAQGNAKREKITWQASFRQTTIDGKIVAQWAVHPNTVIASSANWNNLESNIRIDSTTNLQNSNGAWQIKFDEKGKIDSDKGSRIGKIVINSNGGGTAQRCVFVSTLIGALRTDKNAGCSNNS